MHSFIVPLYSPICNNYKYPRKFDLNSDCSSRLVKINYFCFYVWLLKQLTNTYVYKLLVSINL